MYRRFRASFASSLALLALSSAPSAASAQSYSIANVDGPAWACLLNSACTLSYTLTTSTFTFVHDGNPVAEGLFHSRTYPVAIDPGFGPSTIWFYEYQIDLSGFPPVSSLPDFGGFRLETPLPPITLTDLDGNGTPDQVFVIASGGPGSVGPSIARPSLDRQFFGLPMNPGQISYFFGFVSLYPPTTVEARLIFDGEPVHTLETQGPLSGGVLRPTIFQALESSILALPSDDCVVGDPASAGARRIRRMQSWVSEAERLAAAGQLTDAVVTLAHLRTRIDGIGDDWVPLPPDPCAEPVREIMDALIARLQGRPLHLPLPGVCMQDPTGGP